MEFTGQYQRNYTDGRSHTSTIFILNRNAFLTVIMVVQKGVQK